MLKDKTARDLAKVTVLKVAVIMAIYYACFAGYDGRPVDTPTHLLGPAQAGRLNADTGQGH